MINVDITRLKRNYKEQPIKKKNKQLYAEAPFEDDLRYLYLELNMTVGEVAEYIGVSKSAISSWLSKMNITKPKEMRIANTFRKNMENSGVKCALCRKEVHMKGVKAAHTPEADVKRKRTNNERWGCDYPSQSAHWEETMVKHNREKYGVDYVSQRPDHYKKKK